MQIIFLIWNLTPRSFNFKDLTWVQKSRAADPGGFDPDPNFERKKSEPDTTFKKEPDPPVMKKPDSDLTKTSGFASLDFTAECKNENNKDDKAGNLISGREQKCIFFLQARSIQLASFLLKALFVIINLPNLRHPFYWRQNQCKKRFKCKKFIWQNL